MSRSGVVDAAHVVVVVAAAGAAVIIAWRCGCGWCCDLWLVWRIVWRWIRYTITAASRGRNSSNRGVGEQNHIFSSACFSILFAVAVVVARMGRVVLTRVSTVVVLPAARATPRCHCHCRFHIV